jgi:hypothetical protein
MCALYMHCIVLYCIVLYCIYLLGCLAAVFLDSPRLLPVTPHSPRVNTPLPVRYGTYRYTNTPAISEGCTRSLRINHASRRAPLQPVSKTQVPCTPYHPPNRTGVPMGRWLTAARSSRRRQLKRSSSPESLHESSGWFEHRVHAVHGTVE